MMSELQIIVAQQAQRIAQLEAIAQETAVQLGIAQSHIAEMEADRTAIALALNDAGIEHSGHFRQAKRVRMLVECDAKHVQMVMERQKRLNELRDNAWHAMTGE